MIFCFCFDKNDYLCIHNISLSKYGQRHQSHQSGTRREEENQQMVSRTTWLCADYCFKVVYERLSASDGDVY